MSEGPQPLSSVRVLDLSRLLPGPYASMLLGDLGAQVDKLEDPGGGDYLRRMPPLVDGMNTVFHMLNRGRRSLVLDLKRPEGQDAFLKLIPRYDVVIDGFRPGVMERLGLGYETLRELRPELVYCAITGYGLDGPLAGRAGHDLNYLARAGVLSLSGPVGCPPQLSGVQIADIGGGALFAAVGILAALIERQATGKGRLVDISMCEGGLAFGVFGYGLLAGGMLQGGGRDALMGGIAPYGTYRTSDGESMSLGALEPKFWATFCGGVGLPVEMTALMPGPHQVSLRATVAGIFAKRTRAEWEEFAREHDCCLEPVLSPEEAQQCRQLRHRGVFFDAPTASGETVTSIRAPSVTRPDMRPAPEQGAHSAEILAEAGLSEAEIDALRSAGVTR